MLDNGNYYVEEVNYGVYKSNELMAIPDTYNKDTKTIKVLVKKEVKQVSEEDVI